jgi:hypothetical protein
MNTLKSLAAAAALATGLAGAAQAAPAFNAGIGNRPTTSAVTPVYYGCVPVYRWVHGYHGWQQVYAGQRCPRYGYHGHPHGTFRYNSPGLRIRIGF